jgi:hypothetical protein
MVFGWLKKLKRGFDAAFPLAANEYGFLGFLGDALGWVGDLGKKLAPAAAFIPGVGWVGAAALGAGSALLGKMNDEDVTLGNTLGSMAGGAAWGGLGGMGAQGIANAAGKAGGLSGIPGAVGGWISSNPVEAAQLGLAGYSAISNAQRQGEADQFRDRFAGGLEEKDAYQRQIREHLFGLMNQPGFMDPNARPDLSAIYDSPAARANPFHQPRQSMLSPVGQPALPQFQPGGPNPMPDTLSPIGGTQGPTYPAGMQPDPYGPQLRDWWNYY